MMCTYHPLKASIPGMKCLQVGLYIHTSPQAADLVMLNRHPITLIDNYDVLASLNIFVKFLQTGALSKELKYQKVIDLDK